MDNSAIAHLLCSLLSVLFLQSYATGTTGQIGTIFKADRILESGVQGIFLMEEKVIPVTSVVNVFSAYVIDTKAVRFQIWRPVNIEMKLYKLVGQVRFQAQLVPQVYNISVPRLDPIFAESGDVLAIQNEVDSCPLAYNFVQAGSSTYPFTVADSSSIQLGFQVTFGQTPLPYQFSAAAYYDTDIQKYVSPGTVQTTDLTPPRLTIPSVPKSSGTLEYTGQELANKTSYLEGGQGMFIFPHLVLQTGVVVSFYASFQKKEPVEFQIWRPFQERNGAFRLVGGYRYEPDLIPQRIQVNLTAPDYIFTQTGDVVGFTFPNDVGPIGYRFIRTPENVGPIRASIVENEMPEIGEIVNFNLDKYPYDFAIGVMYDTDLNPLKYGTPPPYLPTQSPDGTSNNPEEETQQPTTPLVINIPVGYQLLGDDYLQVSSRFLEAGAMRTFLHTDLVFPTSGTVRSFYAYVIRAGAFNFQIWRPHVDRGQEGSTEDSLPQQLSPRYKLIASQRVVVEQGDGEDFVGKLISVEVDEEIPVHGGDCLAFSNEQTYSVVGYSFMQVPLYSADTGLGADIDDIVAFDSILPPYKFAVGALYRPVDNVTTAAVTTGATRSDVTPEEPEPEAVSEDTDISWVMDSRFVFGLFIWLIILTVLFLVLCACVCVMCCRRANQEEVKRTSFLYDYESKNSVTRPPSAYLSKSEERDNMNYFHPKTGAKSGPVMRYDSMRENLIDEERAGRNTQPKVVPRNKNSNNNNTIQSVSEIEADDNIITVIDDRGHTSADVSTHM